MTFEMCDFSGSVRPSQPERTWPTQNPDLPWMNECIDSTQPCPCDSRHSGKPCANSAIPAWDVVLCKMESVNPSLVRNFSDQDEVFSSAVSILRQAIAERILPSASIAITHRGYLIALRAFGQFVYESDLEKGVAPSLSLPFLERQGGDFDVKPSTLFDLASLTKPVATTTMAAILYERGLLELDAPVLGMVPEFVSDAGGTIDPRRRDVTFRMLLAHSSGLPAYEKLFLRCHSRDELLHAAFTTPLTADPGSRAEYSDIGFIILAIALERIAGESLDRFCQSEVFGPLGMANTKFNPPAELRPKIPPTADERVADTCGADTPVRAKHVSDQLPSGDPISANPSRSTFRNRIIQGEVQDENAFVLGGVAGHAGLFSTAEDLALFAHATLNGGTPILRPETISLFTQRQSTPPNTSRALGWDTPSHPSQSGKYFGPRSFGHLGYTGTSLWIDPDRQLSVTLLTNRTWPDCSNQAIKQVRPRFHDAVIEALGDR
jgi:serine-type D-Ala-D-Ala carboxypeptidase